MSLRSGITTSREADAATEAGLPLAEGLRTRLRVSFSMGKCSQFLHIQQYYCLG